MKKLFIYNLLLLCAFTAASASEPDSALIQFRQASAVVDPALDNNAAHLDSLANAIATTSVEGVTLFGAASPEGPAVYNQHLSERRAAAMLRSLRNRVDVPDSLVRISAVGRDWAGLRNRVIDDPNVPHKSQVVALLDDIVNNPEPSNPDNLLKLKHLDGGEPYRYLYANIFPALRRAGVRLEYPFKPDLRKYYGGIPVIPAPQPGAPELAPISDFSPEVPACRPLYLALKTNLLYDAAALPSIGFEAYVGKGWSVVGNWTYVWWDKDNVHRYWRAYGGDLAVRRWFGKKAAEKPLTGHHLGLYAGVVTYDFEFGGVGHMGGLPGRNLWDRCNFMAGVEYGYSLPIARRLNLDFTIGLGYLGGKVIRYVPSNNFYVWQKTSQFNWFGPTKVEISLVWLIGCGNYNQKGGRK